MNENGNIVEILSCGDVKFGGKTIVSPELLVGTALVGVNDNLEVAPDDDAVSELSECSETPVVGIFSKVFKEFSSSPKKRKLEKIISLSPKDIRLNYGEIYLNAINTGDIAVFEKMLTSISVPELIMVSRTSAPKSDFVVPNHVEMIGLHAAIKMVELLFLAIPDLVVALQSEKIHIFENGESCIECTYESTGTKVYEIDGVKEGGDKIVLKSEESELSSEAGSDMLMNNRVVVNVEDDDGKNCKVPLGLGPTQRSKSYSGLFTMTMHLDVNKKMYLMIHTSD